MDDVMKQTTLPRLLIAAPKSGSGKTLITCGLLEIFKRRGLRPAACKCGPDYIDPMFHKYVLGIPGRNLDSFFLEPEEVPAVLGCLAGKEQAGMAVLEGVMGYYDGIGGISERASTWEIARITETPAILVMDCKGASLSAAAMAAGFLNFRKNSGIRGLILNRVSEMYYRSLAPVIEKETGIPVLGYLPQAEDYRMESRHLGLFLPGEIDALRERIGRLADQMERTIEIEKLLELAAAAGPLPAGPVHKTPVLTAAGNVRIGVARDEAFCFYYQENLDLMEAMGAELVPFSPLRDPALPERLDGILLGGGYPENYAKELSENTGMRWAVRAAAENGLPMLAECGGFLYLHRLLEGSDGHFYPMAGIVDAKAFRTGKLGRFGYVSLTAPDGLTVKGHEFHYWDSENPGISWEAEKPSGNRRWQCIHERGNQIFGFPHLYYPSCPEFLSRWLTSCQSDGSAGARRSMMPERQGEKLQKEERNNEG